MPGPPVELRALDIGLSNRISEIPCRVDRTARQESDLLDKQTPAHNGETQTALAVGDAVGSPLLLREHDPVTTEPKGEAATPAR